MFYFVEGVGRGRGEGVGLLKQEMDKSISWDEEENNDDK